jgi:hypothetical protein
MLLAALGLIALAHAAPARADDDPIARIISPTPGSSACFRRDYDAAHLKRVPAQTVVSVLLSFRYGKEGHVERIALRRRGSGEPLYFVGSCEWRAKANRDTSGNRIIKSYTKDAGYDCIVVLSPESAEEGGYFLIDLAADGKRLALYLDSPITTWGGSPERGTGGVTLNRDDRVFRLDRTNAAACRPMEELIEGF